MLGKPDPVAMLRRMRPQTFRDWGIYEELEPFGAIRDNYHAAIVAKMVADIAGAKRNDGKPFTYEDLLLHFEQKTVDTKAAVQTGTQTWQQKKAWAYIIAEAVNKSLEK